MTAAPTPATARWSLRRRLLALFAVAGALGALVTALAVASFVRVDQEVNRTVDTLDPLNAAVLDLYGGMLDQETGVRGYALTQQATFLQPYQQGRQEERAATGQLGRLIGGDARLRSDLADVQARIAAWQTDFVQPVLAARGTAVSAALTDKGKTEFDALRTSFTTLRDDLGRDRASARSALSSAVRARWVAISSAIALAVLVSLAIVLTMRREVVRPVAELGAAARLVAAGDTKHRITVDGPPEIAALAADVEAMRASLDHEIGVAQAAEEELSAQADALRRSNTELEQFAYVASHDLQEPLRKVASFCQLLQQRYGGQLDERADTYIGFAVDGAKRMQNLINDLLAFSRVGRLHAGSDPVELDTVFALACRDLSTAIEESGATVTAEPMPTVIGDAGLLTQLFVNLVSNAIKFRTDAPPVITLTCVEGDGEWAFTCTDNGIGIEPQYAEKIFVIFQRLHGREAYSGTGIGLALCKKIVEYHGGRIWLDQEHTGGSRFHFTLPVVPDEAGQTDDTPDETAAVGATGRTDA